MIAGAQQHDKGAGTTAPLPCMAVAAALAVSSMIKLAHRPGLSDPAWAQTSGVDHDE
jgi:hypothetical protein